ncbi:unnamed protein product [Parascedosporium putredinis]|uniref:NACHT domain-containing protein n=1 Tax=Parascedosporium putredinis TaxID=1442378 RepID=A0A9P1H2X0_9PEZI|nr:unnamed protein product [Parascedosporium putredinis]CAI7995221.1 unnamed protein product [Parascedosporium putredinis]
MADPFGIIGVIGVAAQLIQMTVQFGLDLKDAPSDAKSFILELQTLRTILQETDKNITQNPDFVDAFEGRHSTILSQLGSQSSSQTPAKLMLSACEIELRKMVEDLNKRAQSSRKSWEALKGAFTAKKTQEAVQKLQRQCQSLNNLAAIDAISLGAKTYSKVVENDKTMREVREHQLSQEQKEKRELILKWLTPINQTPSQHIDFINRRQSGTGQWLLDHLHFEKWLEIGPNTLFCPGIPGAGKTILTATVVEHLISQYRSDPAVGIAYVYCNYKQHNEQKLEDLLSSLLKQLIEPQLSLPKEVTELYERHKEKRSQPSAEELLATLRLVTSSFARVFVLVDALDECQTANGCRPRFIEGMFSLQVHSGVNLFMTSRFIPDITDKFDKSSWLEIRASREDVERYLDGHIERSESRIIKTMQVEIRKTISDAVDGMFLLAQIYLESLQREIKPKRLKAALNGFRRQIAGSEESNRLQVLSQAYDHAMERINTQESSRLDLANQVLSWITRAQRPLTPTELQHAVTVDAGDSELDKGDLVQIDDMVAVCAGLVTIDEESSIIRLVHFTAQEYFQQAQEKLFPVAQKEIAKICITYLSFEKFKEGACDTNHKFRSRLEDNPLYDYAARYWEITPGKPQYLDQVKKLPGS